MSLPSDAAEGGGASVGDATGVSRHPFPIAQLEELTKMIEDADAPGVDMAALDEAWAKARPALQAQLHPPERVEVGGLTMSDIETGNRDPNGPSWPGGKAMLKLASEARNGTSKVHVNMMMSELDALLPGLRFLERKVDADGEIYWERCTAAKAREFVKRRLSQKEHIKNAWAARYPSVDEILAEARQAQWDEGVPPGGAGEEGVPPDGAGEDVQALDGAGGSAQPGEEVVPALNAAPVGEVHRINYDDGETEIVDLAAEEFRILEEEEEEEDDEGSRAESAMDGGDGSVERQSKRISEGVRKQVNGILEDSRRKLLRMQSIVEEKDDEITRLNGKIAKRDEQLASKEEKLASLRVEIQRKDAELTEARTGDAPRKRARTNVKVKLEIDANNDEGEKCGNQPEAFECDETDQGAALSSDAFSGPNKEQKVETIRGNELGTEEDLQILNEEHNESSTSLQTQIAELQRDLDAAMDDNARLQMKLMAKNAEEESARDKSKTTPNQSIGRGKGREGKVLETRLAQARHNANGNPKRTTRRTLRTSPPVVKVEDIVNGDIRCPVCTKMISFVDNRGCNVMTCTNHHPRYLYFCIHCKKVGVNGNEYVRCDCPKRNTQEARIEAQESRNQFSRNNPTVLD